MFGALTRRNSLNSEEETYLITGDYKKHIHGGSTYTVSVLHMQKKKQSLTRKSCNLIQKTAQEKWM